MRYYRKLKLAMKTKQIVLSLLALAIGFGVVLTPVAARTASALDCTVLPQKICSAADSGSLQSSGTWQILILVLNIMTALVGIVAVAALGFAGFLYATAADDASKVKKAKDMILNTCIGIAAYGLMYIAINFLVPGGVFSS